MASGGGILELIGDALRERAGVQYVELGARSILNRCDTARMPDCWTINPYRGCSFACRYCYARYSHEYLGHEDPLDFERRIFVKRGAPEVLAREASLRKLRARPIAIGTATDPYQPAERTYALTRGILEVLAGATGLEISITTKSALVVRDLDVLGRIARSSALRVHVSLASPRSALARRLEPGAPGPGRRLRTIRTLTDAGIEVGLNAIPILPDLTDGEDDLCELLSRAREAGARWAIVGPAFLSQSTRGFFFDWLAENFPEKTARYRAIFPPGARDDAPSTEMQRWRRVLRQRATRAREQSGLASLVHRERASAVQLALPLATDRRVRTGSRS